jgi:MFS family permease
LGRFAGPIVGGIIATTFGLREPFLLLTLTSALAVAFVFTGERLKTNTPKADNVRPALPRQRLANVVRSNARILLSAGGGQLCAQAIRAARPILIPLFAAGNLGLGADSIGVIVGISAGLDMSLFFVSGWLMDNLGRKFAIIPSFAIQSAGIALIPFTTGFISLLVVVSLVGIGNGIGSGNMMTLGADLAPTDTRGEFLGVWRLIADCGQMGAPLTIGAVAELISLNAACVAISSVGFLGVLIFIFAVPETLNRQPVKLQ